MIVLWGLESDQPLADVRRELARLGVPTTVVDQREWSGTEVRLRVDPAIRGSIRLPDTTLRLADVTAVYARPYDSLRLPAVRSAGPGSAERRRARALDEALWC